MDENVWEFTRDRSSSPRVAKLFRWPEPRLRVDDSSLVFEQWWVHQASGTGPDGTMHFSHHRPKQPPVSIALDSIEAASCYPSVGGFRPGNSTSRARYLTVDLRHPNQRRTIAQVDRVLGTDVDDERSLAEALRSVFGMRWRQVDAAWSADEFPIGTLDVARLAEWHQ